MLPETIPTALNGSNLGLTDISPLSGSILESNAFILPTVSDSNSAATLYLNSFLSCFAAIFAKDESCDSNPLDPKESEGNNNVANKYSEGKNENDCEEL